MDVLPSQRATGMGVHSRVFKYHQVSYCSGVSSDPPFQERKQSIWHLQLPQLDTIQRYECKAGSTPVFENAIESINLEASQS